MRGKKENKATKLTVFALKVVHGTKKDKVGGGQSWGVEEFTKGVMLDKPLKLSERPP